jgi:serine/threonine protein kinase
MGVVYETQHVRLPRRFAVKILARPVDSETTPTLARFRREAEIASTLAHPHIVEVFDYQVAESGAPYLVMELLEGEDLADRLKRVGRIGIVAAIRIIEEIAQALDVAHTGGVVHRDLKPANIFLARRQGREDFVKVLDFGVSKLIDSATLTQEKAMVGTPLYMSPEQAVGTQELTPESDIFSLGAISYEMLTGRRAFAASSIPSILYQIVHGPTPKVAGKAAGLSVAVDEVFARVLSKKKVDRYKRASQFAEDLRLALGRGEVESERSGPSMAFSDEGLAALAAGADRSNIIHVGIDLTVHGNDTEVDSSTKAGDALVQAARSSATPRPRTPSVVVALQEGGELDFDRSYTDLLRPRPWGKIFGAVVLLALLGGGGDALYRYVLRPPAVEPQPTQGAPLPVATPLPPGEPTATAPKATAPKTAEQKAEAERQTARQADRQNESEPVDPTSPSQQGPVKPQFEPESIAQHDPVQFTFHVWPRGAEILVDDKKVEANHLTLHYDRHPHNVIVRAPGYHTLSLASPSTANRTFELRMDRIVVHTKKAAPQRPAHDAAPVQDL